MIIFGFVKRFLTIVFLLLCCRAQAAQVAPHPRLLVQPRPLQADAPWYARRADSLICAFSNQVLEVAPVERTLKGRRLLGVSREALKRVFWLSYTYRAHGGEEYARRAVAEMLAVSRFPDWNPSHFLDVAEMTMALSIGYDWLYDRMTDQERAQIGDAILEKGLKPALNPGDAWFYNTDINWNSVCNAGMVYGALAVWERDSAFCREMLEKSLESSLLAYHAYSPEGGFAEGYNYWGYGTSFQIMLEAAVNRPERIPENFLQSARFLRFMSTPSGRSFNFSDSYLSANFQYMQAWMSAVSGDKSLLYPELHLFWKGARPAEERLLPMFLLYWDPSTEINVPSDNVYNCGGTTPVYIYREGWEQENDAYLGIKGGLPMSSHSHQDQGSFFFEADGVAWATDLGMQEYNSLESVGLDLWDMTQDSDRWDVFRIGPWSHNIITLNGHAPKVNHKADFSRILSEPRNGAVLDLTALYDDDAVSYTREVYLEKGQLHIHDFVEAADTVCTVRWAMCTEASARLEGKVIILEKDGVCRCLRGSADMVPWMGPATYPGPYLHPYDAPNPGKTMVGFTCTLPAHGKKHLHVTLK